MVEEDKSDEKPIITKNGIKNTGSKSYGHNAGLINITNPFVLKPENNVLFPDS